MPNAPRLSQTITFVRYLEPSLYRLTVDAGADEFDWDSLYVVLNTYNNLNQRTGPWDFDPLNGNRPTVPAYWVFLNGRKIGLWYFNRPSAAQVATRRLKGDASFWIERAGEYEFRFEPYHAFAISWNDVRWEPEPEDSLLDGAPASDDYLFEDLFNDGHWSKLSANLDDANFPFHSLLRESFQWARTAERGSMAIPLLAARYRACGDAAALDRAISLIEAQLARPAWGNEKEDAYGHNGDMGAAQVIMDLAIALNWLRSELGEELARRLLGRLERQGDIFIEMALLHRGYWGGSVMQDHGFVSFGHFTSAAYLLWAWTPKAHTWLRLCLPRLARTLAALPTDGAVPTTSYHLVYLYTDKLLLLRELHLVASGEDIYAHPALRNVSTYAYESYVQETGQFLHPSPRGDLTSFSGGHAFFAAMANSFDDARAAWLVQEFLRHVRAKPFIHGVQESATFIGTLWASLFYRPFERAKPAEAPRRLHWFPDSGVAVYRDERYGLLFSTRCGAPNSLTSYRNSACPCDRSILAPLAGNFTMALHGRPLLQTAEGGYKMRSELGNILLIDGKGQLSDYGAPMSCPRVPYGGEFIETAGFDAESETGYIKMQLAAAYDADHEIDSYTREWFIATDGSLRLVDTVSSREPHVFTWLFHTYRRHPIDRADESTFTIRNGDAVMRLALLPSPNLFKCAIDDTLTVWGYVNENDNEPCLHLRVETAQPVSAVTMEMQISVIED